jgi:dihydrofolate synthase / folylpolyglutamate synthase
VVGDGATLVLGHGIAREARAVADRVGAERAARVLHADPSRPALPPLLARGSFQRENFALARLAAQVFLEHRGMQLDEHAVADAAAHTLIEGRMQPVSERPLTILDGAHNPHAVQAMLPSLAELTRGRPLALVMGVLEDKDAASMLELLLPACERAWFTAPPSARALSPAALESRARQLSFAHATSESDPLEALLAAQRWALESGGAVLATGSVYLVGDLIRGLGLAGEHDAPAAQARLQREEGGAR